MNNPDFKTTVEGGTCIAKIGGHTYAVQWVHGLEMQAYVGVMRQWPESPEKAVTLGMLMDRREAVNLGMRRLAADLGVRLEG